MGSTTKGLPSWQKKKSETSEEGMTSTPVQNEDPIQSQASNASSTTSPSEREAPSPANNDDHTYTQEEEASAGDPEMTTSSDQPKQIPSQPASSNSDTHPQSRSSILDAASKFLQHEDLHNAPLERRTAFLQEKGLTSREIDSLLKAQSPEAPPIPTTVAPNISPPPIITYPEFLLHAHRPKALVTKTGIINAIYATGLISGMLYVANQYLFEPMAQQMAAARHELFLTAQKGVDGLNERLENNISVLPTAKKDLVGNGEVDGVISGLEELFHKDIGVQTSPQLESEVGNEKVESVGDDVVQRHASKLQELRGRIQSLLGSSKDVLEEDQATVSTFGDLQTYLEELAYEVRKPALSWENKYGAEDSGSRNHNTRPDEISKFKAEIRSVKGALLSARNFPSSGAGIIRIR